MITPLSEFLRDIPAKEMPHIIWMLEYFEENDHSIYAIILDTPSWEWIVSIEGEYVNDTRDKKLVRSIEKMYERVQEYDDE